MQLGLKKVPKSAKVLKQFFTSKVIIEAGLVLKKKKKSMQMIC